MGVCSIGRTKPCVVPPFHNVVLLGLQLRKQAEAAGTHLVVSFVTAISEEHGDYSIDDEHMERLAGKGLGRLAACLTEIIMCLPVWSHRSRESGLKLLDRLATKNIAKAGTAGEIKAGKLRDSYLREVLGMKPQKLPQRVVHRR